MAYRAFEEWQPVAAAGPQRVAATKGPQISPFTPVEWSVIAIARLDSRGSARASSRLAVFLARLFAMRRSTPLANQRLEALRGFAMLALAGQARNADERRFLDAGFSPAALDLLKSPLN
ncbi:MAG: hypothetical protein H0W74_11085 [Sphingosinicella sp.]|nr:hypothetical protein [Sphingosinicella sp.]